MKRDGVLPTYRTTGEGLRGDGRIREEEEDDPKPMPPTCPTMCPAGELQDFGVVLPRSDEVLR